MAILDEPPFLQRMRRVEQFRRDTKLTGDALWSAWKIEESKPEEPAKKVKKLHLMTFENLSSLGMFQSAANVFNERHVLLEEPPVAHVSDAVMAYQRLSLVNTPWPSREKAAEMTAAIQRALDEQLFD